VPKTIDLIKAADKDAALECLKKQQDFLNNHLLNWVPAMCNDIEKLARHEFYRIIGRLTREYLEMESDTLGSLIRGDLLCST